MGGVGPRRSIVPIEIFSGKTSEDVGDFKENYYRASAINNWSPQLTSLILPTYLGGRARDFYINLPPDTKASANETFSALESHFNSSAIRYMARTQVHDRVQKTNESVADYYQNMSAMVRKAWGDLSRETQREKLTDCFVRGLRQPIKKIFFDHQPSSSEEALKEAEGREIYLKSKQRALNVNQVEVEKRGTKVGGGGDRKSEGENDKQLRTLRQEFDEMKHTLSIKQVDAEKQGTPEGGAFNKKVDFNESDQSQMANLKRELADMRVLLHKKDEQLVNQARRLEAAVAQNSPGGGQNHPTQPTPRRTASPATPRYTGFREPPSCWSCGSKSHFRAECPNNNLKSGGPNQQ